VVPRVALRAAVHEVDNCQPSWFPKNEVIRFVLIGRNRVNNWRLAVQLLALCRRRLHSVFIGSRYRHRRSYALPALCYLTGTRAAVYGWGIDLSLGGTREMSALWCGSFQEIIGGINTYRYVDGDPITSVDPSGTVPVWVPWAVKAAAAAAGAWGAYEAIEATKDAYDRTYGPDQERMERWMNDPSTVNVDDIQRDQQQRVQDAAKIVDKGSKVRPMPRPTGVRVPAEAPQSCPTPSRSR